MELQRVAEGPRAVERELRLMALHGIGILKSKRPERDVHDVHAEIADRAVAVTDPTVPAVRVHPVLIGRVGIIVAYRRTAAPEIPVHSLRRGNRRRTLIDRVAAIVIRPHLAHFSERAFRDAVNAVLHRRERVAVGAALRDETWVLAGLCKDEIAFRRRETEGLIKVDVDAAAHRHHGRKNMLVIRRLNDDGVDFSAHFLEHVLIRRKTLGGREVLSVRRAARLGDILLKNVEAHRIGVDDRDKILAEDAVDHHFRLKPAADQRDADLCAFRNLPRPAQPEPGAADIEKRQRRYRRKTLKNVSSCCFHFISFFTLFGTAAPSAAIQYFSRERKNNGGIPARSKP